MNLVKDFADTAVCPVLSKLSYNATYKEVETWIHMANTLLYTYQRILRLSSNQFWCTVIYNDSLLDSLDVVLHVIPKPFEEDEYRLTFGQSDALATAANQLKICAFALFLRLAVYNNNLDPNLSQKEYTDIIRCHRVMPVQRIERAISLFSFYEDILVQIMKQFSHIYPRFEVDLEQMGVEFEQIIPELESKVTFLLDEFHTSEGLFQVRSSHLIDQFYNLVVDIFYSTSIFISVCHKAGIQIDVNKWVSNVPSLLETIHRSFTMEVLVDVAMVQYNYPLKRFLCLRAQCEQAAAHFFCNVIELVSKNQKLILIQSALRYERFMYVLNEKKIVTSFLDDHENNERDYVEKAMLKICEAQGLETLKQTEKMGLLKDLGNMNALSQPIRDAIDEITQIMPHISQCYAHLCLRHFGYDSAKVIEALLTHDASYPMDLRRLEGTDLTASRAVSISLPALSFENEELIQSTISHRIESLTSSVIPSESKDEKNVFKGLFSLAPPTSKSAEESTSKVEEKAMFEIVFKLSAALKRIKLRADEIDTDIEHQEGPSGERLVPMVSSKKYSGIKKFQISDADKVAIRPIYEKYKYEIPSDNGIYDDEYDDEYEQKEFIVEPLNPDISSSDNEEDQSKFLVQENNSLEANSTPVQHHGEEQRVFGRGGVNRRRQINRLPITGGSLSTSNSQYTGGRERQVKERRKGIHKQRGADKKMRGSY